MDFAAARAALPSMTRAVFGEDCDVLPRVAGRMATVDDPDRAALIGVRGRFDFAPEDSTLGGGRTSGERMAIGGETATVSFDRAALPWVPTTPDRVRRVRDGVTEIYEIVRPGRDGGKVVIFYLSRVS